MADSASFPQLDVSSYPSQLLWLIVCFVVLFIFIKHYYTPRVKANLTKRADYIEHNKRDAESTERANAKLKQTQDTVLLQEKSNAAKLVNDALKVAQETIAATEQQARISIADKLAVAVDDFRTSATEQEPQILEYSGYLAKLLYKKITGQDVAINDAKLLNMAAESLAKIRGKNDY